ncbi:MAG: alpha-L-fucosidase, partial [Dehalococcoidia bacterium]
MTINESWGYNTGDDDWKSSRKLIHTLCEVAGRGGNLLLNVGPMGDGRLQPEVVERLADVGAWVAKHSESIVGTKPGLEPWQFYGPSTRRGRVGDRVDERVYLHLLMRPYDTVSVRGVPIRRLRSVRVLGSGDELTFETRASIVDTFANPDPMGEVTIAVPEHAIDPHATVLALEFAEQP